MRHHAIAVASGFGDLALCRQESDRPAFVARLETLHQEHPTPAADFQKEQASLGLATPKRVEALANLAGSSLLRARFEWAEVFYYNSLHFIVPKFLLFHHLRGG